MKADTSSWVGKVVRDIYGRTMGNAVGVVFDLSGEVASIAVEEAGTFKEIRPEMVVSDHEDLEVMPEWKVDARESGVEGASLERRLAALAQMVERKEVSQETYDSLHSKLMVIRGTHDQLTSRILSRLDNLEREDQTIDTFYTMVRLQFLAGEINEESFNLTDSRCKALKEANAKEELDIRKIVEEPQLGNTSDVVLSKQIRAEPEKAPSHDVPPPAEEVAVAAPEPKPEAQPEPAPMIEVAQDPEPTIGSEPLEPVAPMETVQPVGEGAPPAFEPAEIGGTGLPSLNSLRNRRPD